MAKRVHTDVLDAALNILKSNVLAESVCSTEPTTYTEGLTTYKLAIKAGLTATDFTGPAAGTGAGNSPRKLTVNSQTAIAIDATGTAQHIALLDTTNSKLMFVTTCSSQVLTSGGTVTIPAWADEIAAPT